MKLGYIRVSTQEQNTIRQETLMELLGRDEVYIDRISGKNTDRLELKKLLSYVRKGNTGDGSHSPFLPYAFCRTFLRYKMAEINQKRTRPCLKNKSCTIGRNM